jgi:hypothetical protein
MLVERFICVRYDRTDDTVEWIKPRSTGEVDGPAEPGTFGPAGPDGEVDAATDDGEVVR